MELRGARARPRQMGRGCSEARSEGERAQLLRMPCWVTWAFHAAKAAEVRSLRSRDPPVGAVGAGEAGAEAGGVADGAIPAGMRAPADTVHSPPGGAAAQTARRGPMIRPMPAGSTSCWDVLPHLGRALALVLAERNAELGSEPQQVLLEHIGQQHGVEARGQPAAAPSAVEVGHENNSRSSTQEAKSTR